MPSEMSDTPLRLFLFTADLQTGLRAERAGVDSIIVDWEQNGKHARQNGHDTQINDDSTDAVAILASHLRIPVTVRVNSLYRGTPDEVQRALDAGASTLMLPMATEPAQVEQFVRLVRGRAKTLIQIETQQLADQVRALRSIDWDYVHVGLNDLKISRGSQWLWEPLADGTIETICRSLEGRVVGFGGATIIGGGFPIPFLNLLQEMARLDIGMALLRRSFLREVVDRDWTAEIQALQAASRALRKRRPSAVEQDHVALTRLLEMLTPAPRPAPIRPRATRTSDSLAPASS